MPVCAWWCCAGRTVGRSLRAPTSGSGRRCRPRVLRATGSRMGMRSSAASRRCAVPLWRPSRASASAAGSSWRCAPTCAWPGRVRASVFPKWASAPFRAGRGGRGWPGWSDGAARSRRCSPAGRSMRRLRRPGAWPTCKALATASKTNSRPWCSGWPAFHRMRPRSPRPQCWTTAAPRGSTQRPGPPSRPARIPRSASVPSPPGRRPLFDNRDIHEQRHHPSHGAAPLSHVHRRPIHRRRCRRAQHAPQPWPWRAGGPVADRHGGRRRARHPRGAPGLRPRPLAAHERGRARRGAVQDRRPDRGQRRRVGPDRIAGDRQADHPGGRRDRRRGRCVALRCRRGARDEGRRAQQPRRTRAGRGAARAGGRGGGGGGGGGRGGGKRTGGEGGGAVVRGEPLGVVGVITPWNFPFFILAERLPFILAAGCTAIVKPAEATSGSTLWLCELLAQAGLPPGVVNVVTGRGAVVGQRLLDSDSIDMVSVTGSTETGRKAIAASAGNIKKLGLELGGKNPHIVFADADLDDAADGVAFNAGQCCVGGSRLVVERSVAEVFTAKLAEEMCRIRVGDPLDARTQVGALFDKGHTEKVLGYVEEGVRMGATVVCGGRRTGDQRGYFMQPTLMTGGHADTRVLREEIFGPVLAVVPFDTFEDAIAIANDSIFGLSASIWTKDLSKALRAMCQVQAGRVWINTTMDNGPETPLGGMKQSDLGREAGLAGIEEYTEVKTAHINLLPRARWIA